MFSSFVRKALASAAFAAALALLPAAGATAAERTLSLGANNNENDFIADGFRFFAKRIGELSNGELKVDIFWSSQLGGAKEMVQGVAAGSIDMQMDVIELLVTFEPRIGILSLPLVFRDNTHFAHFLGSPIFDRVRLHMGNGKVLEIVTRNNSAKNMYIQSATLNGKPWSKPWFSHADIANGATLVLTMGPQPSKTWGTDPRDAPPSMTHAAP